MGMHACMQLTNNFKRNGNLCDFVSRMSTLFPCESPYWNYKIDLVGRSPSNKMRRQIQDIRQLLIIQGIKKKINCNKGFGFQVMTNEFFRKNTRDLVSSLQLVALTLKSH